MQRSLAERPNELHAIHVRHLQIEHDHVEGLLGQGQLGERAIPIISLLELVLLLGERQMGHLPHQGGVINDQQAHGDSRSDGDG